MLLGVVEQNLKPVKLLTQQLPTFLWFRDHRSVAQQRWIRFYSPSNMVGATRVHYTWSPKSYGLYPSHDALQVPTVSGVVCTPLTNTVTTTPKNCRANNIGSCCVRLHVAFAPCINYGISKFIRVRSRWVDIGQVRFLSIYAWTETKRCRPIMQLTSSLLD